MKAPSGVGGGKVVRILNGVLDESETPRGETIILRGVIDPETLDGIQFDTYQREILSHSKVKVLAETTSVLNLDS